MLVLTRRSNESIIINGNIIVKVLKVEKDGSVKLGIEAPKEISILRDNAKITKRKEVDDN